MYCKNELTITYKNYITGREVNTCGTYKPPAIDANCVLYFAKTLFFHQNLSKLTNWLKALSFLLLDKKFSLFASRVCFSQLTAYFFLMKFYCAVPQNIPTYPLESHWKFQKGRVGISKSQMFFKGKHICTMNEV